ncbi:hypothetical protein D8B21_19350 [Verminephrobacter aporrectodeae subsp. tuberculatae]|uniref:hypothetical protein n=1 Tax=Verminephrobacter aporrectodeae TaxID=1110389 RepID=UPI0002378528|nr:hypothetical protein [Verminephrobacter aporrectodeae]MCW8166987.1 hypothetical protein [Verminephrobacter aporrectodeae subsp. tuberculatae]MCW8208098.1 hypothetical protein [Verminephrobacter aporrectodeae subsp. tuberculatae]
MPEGEYRPINRSVLPAKKDVLDFTYEGDILGALPALKEVAPQIDVMPSLGRPSPLLVRIHLQGTTLENALRAIGEQGGDVADVVWSTTRHQGGNQAFVRFRTSNTESQPSTNQRVAE